MNTESQIEAIKRCMEMLGRETESQMVKNSVEHQLFHKYREQMESLVDLMLYIKESEESK